MIKKLKEINKNFYQKAGYYFDISRSYAWEGWKKILPFIDDIQDPKVLDIGCGNGRFGVFLREGKPDFDETGYVGIDMDSYLLKRAQESLPGATFIKADLMDFGLEDLNLPHKNYDLIVLFGFLHHIPLFEKRLDILKKLPSFLSHKGKIVLSSWEFTDMPNFPENTVAWEEFDIDPKDVEEGDYLLTWSKGVEAVRYCHYLSPDEVQELCFDSGLCMADSYKTGKRGDAYNRYFVISV